jgi:hypothetical protein
MQEFYGDWNGAIRHYNGGWQNQQKKSVDRHMKRYWAAVKEIIEFTTEVERI